MTEWSNERVIIFLQTLQTEPCLWNPQLKSFKNRRSQSDAWRRIMEILPFQTTVEDMKKKKESLMGYYRIHLNKIKKSLNDNEVYTTNWFAFETMDNFLRKVYDRSPKIKSETDNKNEVQEKNDSHLNSSCSSEAEEATQNIQEDNGTRPEEYKSSQSCGKKRQLKEKQEIEDECEIFGRLLAVKLKKIINPSTRDTLMNDIQNLLYSALMADRQEQRPGLPQTSTSLNFP